MIIMIADIEKRAVEKIPRNISQIRSINCLFLEFSDLWQNESREMFASSFKHLIWIGSILCEVSFISKIEFIIFQICLHLSQVFPLLYSPFWFYSKSSYITTKSFSTSSDRFIMDLFHVYWVNIWYCVMWSHGYL